MDRNLLSLVPAGVSIGLEDGGSPVWGLLGSQILAETATGTHGPGALINDNLTPSLRYVPVLLNRTAVGFRLYPNGSYEGPVPSSASYNLYEQGVGLAPGSPGAITIASAVVLILNAIEASLPDLAVEADPGGLYGSYTMRVEHRFKQPQEVLDFDFSFEQWLAAKPGATPVDHEVVVDPGITVVGSVRTGGTVKVVLSGGQHGRRYRVTVRLDVTMGTFTVVRELDAYVVVREL